MKKFMTGWQAAGFVFTAVLGTLLHFVFDWTGGSIIAALFSAVNESIWEHLKLIFYPMLLFAGIEYFFWGKQTCSFWQIKLMGLALGVALIPALYYTYTGAFGVSVSWLNIAIFFIAAGVSFWVETKLFQRKAACRADSRLAVLLLLGMAVMFTVFTFRTPRIPLFEDPVTGSYGFCRKMDGQ